MDNGLWRTCLVCGNEFSSAFSDCPECHLKVGGTLYINLKPTKEGSYLKQDGESDFDPVHKPSHYQGEYGLEVRSVVENFIGDLQGMAAADFKDVVKYILRFQKKNGSQDLRKAERCLKWLADAVEKEEREKGKK